MKFNADKEYMIDGTGLRLLEIIKVRLYDDRKLEGDERRDLANTMDAILHSRVVEIDENLKGIHRDISCGN